ncbi:MAG: hypothetical protein ACQEQD_04640, partial [Bacillota bacterium]
MNSEELELVRIYRELKKDRESNYYTKDLSDMANAIISEITERNMELMKENEKLLEVIKSIKSKTRGASWIGIESPKTHKRIDIS